MSTMDQLFKNTSANDLFTELNDKSAETISGGLEIFTLKNEVGRPVKFRVDGKSFTLRRDRKLTLTTNKGGNLAFVRGFQGNNKFVSRRNLGDGGVYVFKQNQKDPSIVRLITRVKPN